MCVTVCNIGHDQNQQFICNERKAAQLASVFQTSNITTNNRFCNQINTYIMHNIRAYIANDPGSRHRQQTVISANAVFCHRIFLLLISIQSLQLLADLVCSCSTETYLHWGFFSHDMWRQCHKHAQETGVTRKWVHHDNTPPLCPAPHWSVSSDCGRWLVSRDWSHTRPPAWAGHCLLCVDLWQTPTLIGGILTQLSTLRHWTWWLGRWPLHELSLAAETKRWHIPQHEDTHNLWHKHAAIMLTRLSFIILTCSDTSWCNSM